MAKPQILKIAGLALVGGATAAYQDIHGWLGEAQRGKFDWQLLSARVATGLLAGALAGVGVNVATA